MTKEDALKLALEAHHKNERHNSAAETNYWCNQYKLLAHQAIEALAQPEERNFCPRCGKRTADLTTIHTCTPPQGNI